MKDAIWKSDPPILCHYVYYPLFVNLTQDEMEQYNFITDKLRKFIDTKTGKYKKEAEMLLMARKRIIHKAANKKQKVAELLDQQKKKGTLLYLFRRAMNLIMLKSMTMRLITKTFISSTNIPKCFATVGIRIISILVVLMMHHQSLNHLNMATYRFCYL